jgi:hypothetical protein
VAEFGVAITLALLRDIPAAIDVVRNGGWWFEAPKGDEGYVFRDLADCRIGLAGYGSINRHYRSFVQPYGCAVTIYDPFVADDVTAADAVARAGSLVELARTSDILVVAIPPTPSTLGVIDAKVIEALARGSVFVLLSRMAVVEQEALWHGSEPANSEPPSTSSIRSRLPATPGSARCQRPAYAPHRWKHSLRPRATLRRGMRRRRARAERGGPASRRYLPRQAALRRLACPRLETRSGVT